MSFFEYSNNDFFGTSSSTSIECIKCSEEPEYMRCKCCNEIVTIVDIIKHELKNGIKINLVKFNGLNCIKILGRHVQKIVKYIRDGNTNVDGIDFEYKANYIISKTSDGQEKKVVNNIEYVKETGKFKSDTLNLKYVLMCNFPYVIPQVVKDDNGLIKQIINYKSDVRQNVDYKGNVLIDVRKLNVKIPEGLF